MLIAGAVAGGAAAAAYQRAWDEWRGAARGVVVALAEMSDKTALATVTLASHHDWIGVWIGSTVGMVLADGLAIGVGRLLHQRLPDNLLQKLADVPYWDGEL